MKTQIATDAFRCAEWLIKAGFNIISIEMDSERPRIKIHYSKKCHQLRGSWVAIKHDAQKTTLLMTARLAGCTIEWKEVRG